MSEYQGNIGGSAAAGQLQMQGMNPASLFVQAGGGQLGSISSQVGYAQAVPYVGQILPTTEPSHERLVAMRTELIRLSHCNSSNPESVVARADAYLSFILNGISTQGESINGED